MFPSRILSYSHRGISPRKCFYLKFNETNFEAEVTLNKGPFKRKGKYSALEGLTLTLPLTKCIAMLTNDQNI